MRVELRLFASLRRYLSDKADGSNCIMEVGEGTTIQGLLDRLDIPPDIPKLIFLNGTHARADTVLKDGDRVGVFPPIAGG